ncbi:discoidin domain-containing protein [Tuberibacillus calidus]|uniref:discoidin domain-containing protein n=1 Tax=Tuberibacillus calidus TaxID=340097 RepID=UPI00041BC2C9|nr:discoidin domain-containing protein [Tuberibacillus calidus]
MPIFTDRFKRYVDTKISEIELNGSGIKKFNTTSERLGYQGQDGEVVADLETDLIYIWDSPTSSWKETGHSYLDLETRFQPKGDYALKTELHSHSNKSALDRLGINSNNKLTIDGQEISGNGGSTVSDSTINGNIVVDGNEIKVYDDSSIIQELGQMANLTDIPVFDNKETLDKIGEDENGDLIFNGSPISGAGSVVEKSQTNGNIIVDGNEVVVFDDSSIIQELGQKANVTDIPVFDNKDVLDKLSENNGELEYNGQPIGGSGSGIPMYDNIDSFPEPEQLDQIVFNKGDSSFYRSVGLGSGNPIPKMTGNTTDGVTVSASSVYQNSSNYAAFKAFDGNASTYWTPNVNNAGWLQIDFGKQKIIKQYGFKIGSFNYSPKDFTFQGSNDGVNWDILDSESITDWVAGETRNWEIEDPKPYRYYKLDITSVNHIDYQPQIWEISMVELLWERLTETPQEIKENLGSKIEVSQTNGNILVDGDEVKVYDDSDIKNDIESIQNTLEDLNGYNPVPIMTDYTNGEITITESSNAGAGFEAWRAFDGISNNDNLAWAANTYTGWLQVDFGEENKINIIGFSYTARGSHYKTSATAFTLQGSNDGSTWVDIYSQNGLSWSLFETKTFKFDNQESYRYYRLNVSNDPVNTFVAIAELTFIANKSMSSSVSGIPKYDNIDSFPHPEQLNQIVFNKEDSSFYRSIGIGNGDPIPQMDGNTKDGITVSASSVYQNSSRYFAFNAFDDNNTTYWTPNVNNTGWLQIDFGKQRTIRQYGFKINLTDYAPKDFTFQGSNDGVNWDILDSQSITDWTTGEARNWDIENPRPYQYYKLDITSVNRLNYQPQIWELNVVEQLWERLTETPEEIENKLIALENSIINKNSSSQTIPAGQEITINNIPQNAIVQVETDLGDSSYLVNDPEIQIKKVGSDLIIKNNGATDKNVNVIIL